MWTWTLAWLTLALLVFWATGARKRLRRLRLAVGHSLIAVNAHLLQLLEVLRSCTRVQALKEKVASVAVDGAQDAEQALQRAAQQLEVALLHAQQHSVQADAIVALEGAWQEVQSAWQHYVQQSQGHTAIHDAHIEEWSQRWQQAMTVLDHSAEQFNAAVHAYNGAIAQFPASVIARISGLQPGRPFQKDAAPSARTSA